jgi:hypothetical protein
MTSDPGTSLTIHTHHRSSELNHNDSERRAILGAMGHGFSGRVYLIGREPVIRMSTSLRALYCQSGPGRHVGGAYQCTEQIEWL